MLPGFHHCGGGPGPNVFGAPSNPLVNLNDPERDIVGAVVRWVEEDEPPARIIATKFVGNDPNLGVSRTRPICPYPQVAQYTGFGSIDDAANFVCGNSTD